MTDKFTKTEQAILDVLGDGVPHLKAELHACLPDELGDISNIRRHISAIRKKLPAPLEIACVVRDRRHKYLLYRHLRMDE